MAWSIKNLLGGGTDAGHAPALPRPDGRAGVPEPPKRSRNTAWMIVGGVLVLLSGLTAASVVSSLSATVDVLVAARPIAEGAVVTDGDLRTVSIAANTGDIQAMAPNEADALIGRIASGPVGNGSILHPDQFTTLNADTVETSNVIVGATLGSNNLPVLNLKPGDRVRLYSTGGGSSFNQSSDSLAVAEEITDGEVVAVERIGNQGTLHVSMQVNESLANLITQRVETGSLSLALIESRPSLEPTSPLTPAEPLSPAEPEVDG